MLFTDKHGQLFVRYHVAKLGGVCDVITVRCGVVLIQRGVQEDGHRFTSQPIRRLETVNKDVSDSASCHHFTVIINYGHYFTDTTP